MFLYMVLALSRGPVATFFPADEAAARSQRKLLESAAAVGGRAALAAVGVCVVGASVLAALGLCSLMGIRATLIMMEVC
jgi:hypothetical protein